MQPFSVHPWPPANEGGGRLRANALQHFQETVGHRQIIIGQDKTLQHYNSGRHATDGGDTIQANALHPLQSTVRDGQIKMGLDKNLQQHISGSHATEGSNRLRVKTQPPSGGT